MFTPSQNIKLPETILTTVECSLCSYHHTLIRQSWTDCLTTVTETTLIALQVSGEEKQKQILLRIGYLVENGSFSVETWLRMSKDQDLVV